MRVFITGGSRGIGKALVEACVRAGHDVAFTYRSEKARADAVVAEALAAAGAGTSRRCRAWQLDVSDVRQVEAIGESVLAAFDSIDVVVNNAAIVRIGMAATLSDEDWHDVIETNLSGPFYVSRFFLEEFLINGRGRFVHISSVANRGMQGQIAYCASKAGLDGLSAALAKEYGRKGITSNVLRLGFFDTEMTRIHMAEDRMRFWNDHCPVGRVGRLSEVCDAVLYLMSEGAAFVNGQTLNLTGGLDWVM